MTETAEKAVSLLGVTKPYHERARRALPILVQQARALETIQYGLLAAELGMPNPRNLNYPLGAIGQTLLDLSDEWGARVPPLQALVINKSDGLPGEGVAHFMPDAKVFARATRAERRMIVQAMLREVYTYPDWNRVLVRLGVKPNGQTPVRIGHKMGDAFSCKISRTC